MSQDMPYAVFRKLAFRIVFCELSGKREKGVAMVEGIDRTTVPVLKIADCKGVTIQNTISMIDPAKKTPQCLNIISVEIKRHSCRLSLTFAGMQ